MDWNTHVGAFYSELIVRMALPAKQDWKEILSEIIFTDKKGRKDAEGSTTCNSIGVIENLTHRAQR